MLQLDGVNVNVISLHRKPTFLVILLVLFSTKTSIRSFYILYNVGVRMKQLAAV